MNVICPVSFLKNVISQLLRQKGGQKRFDTQLTLKTFTKLVLATICTSLILYHYITLHAVKK